jgi:hypothetical protein
VQTVIYIICFFSLFFFCRSPHEGVFFLFCQATIALRLKVLLERE